MRRRWSARRSRRRRPGRRRRRGQSRRMPCARAWRCASARRCQTCQVARSSATRSTTRSRGLGDPLVGDLLGLRAVSEAVPRPCPGRPLAAEDRGRLGQPGRALVGLGAGCVLGLTGLVPRLLGKGDGLTVGRRATVLGLECGRELAAAGLDGAVPLGPRLGQPLVDADDLAHGPLAVTGPVALVQAAAVGSRNAPRAGRPARPRAGCCTSPRG